MASLYKIGNRVLLGKPMYVFPVAVTPITTHALIWAHQNNRAPKLLNGLGPCGFMRHRSPFKIEFIVTSTSVHPLPGHSYNQSEPAVR